MIQTKIEKVKLSKLSPTDKNPRKISKDDLNSLKKSLKEFPEMQEIREIVVDENYRILGGHQRYKALKEMGKELAQVKVVSGLTEKQKDEFIIKDNIANGDWDIDKLDKFWDAEEVVDWGLFERKERISDEKEIKEKPPQIVSSFLTFDYNDEIALPIQDDTALKLMEEMVKYKEDNGSYEGFWDQRLK